MQSGSPNSDAVQAGRQIRRPATLLGAILSVLGPLSSTVGFFLPWASGVGVLSGRSFSGLDLALTLRKYELVTESQMAGVLALVLYFIPAISIASLVVTLLMPTQDVELRKRQWGMAIVSGFVLLVSIAAIVALRFGRPDLLSMQPQYGLVLVMAGAVLAIAGNFLHSSD